METTSFSAPCEACAEQHRHLPFQPVVVEGRLRLDADVGFLTCFRGHRIRVRRIGRLPVSHRARRQQRAAAARAEALVAVEANVAL